MPPAPDTARSGLPASSPAVVQALPLSLRVARVESGMRKRAVIHGKAKNMSSQQWHQGKLMWDILKLQAELNSSTHLCFRVAETIG